MGFFSWNCRGCGESIRAPYDGEQVSGEDGWMNRATVRMHDGGEWEGEYNGYGVLIRDGAALEGGESPTLNLNTLKGWDVWHTQCYRAVGMASTFPPLPLPTDEPENAADQGYFVDDGSKEAETVEPSPYMVEEIRPFDPSSDDYDPRLHSRVQAALDHLYAHRNEYPFKDDTEEYTALVKDLKERWNVMSAAVAESAGYVDQRASAKEDSIRCGTTIPATRCVGGDGHMGPHVGHRDTKGGELEVRMENPSAPLGCTHDVLVYRGPKGGHVCEKCGTMVVSEQALLKLTEGPEGA